MNRERSLLKCAAWRLDTFSNLGPINSRTLGAAGPIITRVSGFLFFFLFPFFFLGNYEEERKESLPSHSSFSQGGPDTQLSSIIIIGSVYQ